MSECREKDNIYANVYRYTVERNNKVDGKNIQGRKSQKQITDTINIYSMTDT